MIHISTADFSFDSTMNTLTTIFGKTDGIVIGVVHFPPLPGVENAAPLEMALAHAVEDLRAFEKGGVDAIIIENNYDLPHRIHVLPETVAAMTSLGTHIRSQTTLPIGVCVLWNDYASSFAVAKAIGGQFIRIPVFVDTVQTDFGTITGDPTDVRKTRSALQADDVAILADVHVKHATILSKTSIAEAALLAQNEGADGVIVTGKWTGEPPSDDDLSSVREATGDLPIFAGSGANTENIGRILHHANGVIVSTSLKSGTADAAERNVKSWMQRIDESRVRELVERIHPSSLAL